MASKVVVIIGATGGLGKEISMAFFKDACKVVINYYKSEKLAKELVEIMGNSSMPIRADVSKFVDVSNMAKQVYERWGYVDILINNAGITKDALLIKQSEEDWDRIINVNLKGVFNSIKAFSPIMINGGHIVNISSYSGLKGKEGQAAYSASKAALIGLTKTVALELASAKIKVNAIIPGYMPTKMGIMAEKALIKAKKESILNTLSDPKEVAQFIVNFTATKNITGQIICLESRII